LKAKDYLKQIKKQDTIIHNKLTERAQLKDIALGITSNSDGERVQSSGSKQKMADAVDRCVDMDNEINGLVDKLIDLKREANGIIEQLSTASYDVLHKIYFQFMTFDEVADALCRSKSWVVTVHGRALSDVQSILNEMDAV
jgi:hypothetical protein